MCTFFGTRNLHSIFLSYVCLFHLICGRWLIVAPFAYTCSIEHMCVSVCACVCVYDQQRRQWAAGRHTISRKIRHRWPFRRAHRHNDNSQMLTKILSYFTHSLPNTAFVVSLALQNIFSFRAIIRKFSPYFTFRFAFDVLSSLQTASWWSKVNSIRQKREKSIIIWNLVV